MADQNVTTAEVQALGDNLCKHWGRYSTAPTLAIKFKKCMLVMKLIINLTLKCMRINILLSPKFLLNYYL